MEIAGGIASIVAGAALWDSGWVHWLLIGVGLFGLSPWPGAAAILRRAERHPEVLNHDPERGRARVRRTAPILVSVCAVAGRASAISSTAGRIVADLTRGLP